MLAIFGAIVVVIYNFLPLTIDTNINQFIKVYHISIKLQHYFLNFILLIFAIIRLFLIFLILNIKILMFTIKL